MRWIVALIFIFMIIFYFSPTNEQAPLNDTSIMSEQASEKIVSEGLGTWIGKTEEEVKRTFGQPARIDPSAYGYVWWVYNDPKTYMQIGILDGRVVTIYACGPEVNVAPFQLNRSINDLLQTMPLHDTIHVQLDDGVYRFQLTEEDLMIQPLLSFGDAYVQLYIDRFTGNLSSIRWIDGETLVKLRPYELEYRGPLPEVTLDETMEKQVEQANANQIFDITNVMRARHGVPPLTWDDRVVKVAYEHSKDMAENKFFAHESPTTGDLQQRLIKANIPFEVAGENIAAEYIDAPAVVEAWLNSRSHRQTLLNEELTHLGVGVYKRHYTQNFIRPFSPPK
ncbi:membrane protein [Anoxybacillus gonensis]|uniref:CAP domain-containing protein n=1 Tax=Anoxybacillus gonensis TaxID=198467 RepID=A0AAW7TH51_9BACL|nr:CAP domain-containing protein [Anoxybacillus gonensis]AKS37927.1 membrane protein [Anoxybacillus gonensis]KGP61004.1 membrane protein [Anoxybacillus gonensis]MCX8045337.1 CAP domain-containing protein [Anoxybacillus gonensis]MDO0877404.1 CAP domain-containing protein [Anoxybacillus gonensis]